ncbi:T9SS type A sorting domain-containing protein [bacterium]|nr:T9SS type A sorting domain-containing protein [bacterium]
MPHPDSTFSDPSPETGQMYYYQIKTRNNEMVLGAPTPVEEGQLATHHLNILLVDATPNGSGGTSAPPDAEVDLFYLEATENFIIEAMWDRFDSSAASVTISDADLAPFSLVLVYADYQTASISNDTTAFRKYLENGGKLVISGWRLSYVLDGLVGYEHTLGAGDFLYDLAGIDEIQVVAPPAMEFIGATGALGYPDVDFDAVGFPGWGGALPQAEAIFTDPLPGEVDVIANFNAVSGGGSVFHNQPVAVRKSDLVPSWTIIDFPLYYMTAATSIPFLDRVLTDMGAPPVGVKSDDGASLPTEFGVMHCYPNPFNAETIIPIALPERSHIQVTLYDLMGRKIANIYEGVQNAGHNQIRFNATGLASGIYFYRIEAKGYEQGGKFSIASKMILLK